MWRVIFNQYRNSGPLGGMYQQYAAARANPASRVAMIAAAVVIGLPLLVLLLAAVLVGMAVFLVMVAVMRVVMLVTTGLDVLRGAFTGNGSSGGTSGGDTSGADGRENVRVIQRD